ncbi:RNA recognition motif domain protein [Kalmanozyma brasiliensis GHG001]|uniref:RRM domain-containing protein n=1 Tax=Kalmanozyma brasiliensis (strain GHG001) TaxID=1365824 RepID=V5E7F8_KALBG|nr:RNA recognition motif domain protein [Kalmanozyma brasiliensis GHG001]EST06221.1 RNA recognition motif domain protein [Kalmanozyma brasiliensis GHG001]
MTMPYASKPPGRSTSPTSQRVNVTMPIRPLVHVANLPATTTERDLRETFGSLGQIQSVKVVTSRSSGGLVYGFVEYVDVASAERSIRTMDGWLWFGTPIKVCWARHSMHPEAKIDTPDVDRPNVMRSNPGAKSHLFVGDLSPEVDDGVLQSIFSRFPSLADVRVMYDPETGKSRGFGFISFRSKHEAEECIAVMQGQWLGGRQIRVNWASQKNPNQASSLVPPDFISAYTAQEPAPPSQQRTNSFPPRAPPSPGLAPPGHHHDPLSQVLLPRRHTTLASRPQFAPLQINPGSTAKYDYEQILAEAPASQTSVYVGNVSPLTSQQDLVRIFAPFNHGQPLEARIPPGRGYGFVTLASHAQAASAICTLSIQGVFMHSRWLRFGWQKDRNVPTNMLQHRSESAPEHMLYTQKQYKPQQQQGYAPDQQQRKKKQSPSSSSSNEFQPF